MRISPKDLSLGGVIVVGLGGLATSCFLYAAGLKAIMFSSAPQSRVVCPSTTTASGISRDFFLERPPRKRTVIWI